MIKEQEDNNGVSLSLVLSIKTVLHDFLARLVKNKSGSSSNRNVNFEIFLLSHIYKKYSNHTALKISILSIFYLSIQTSSAIPIF